MMPLKNNNITIIFADRDFYSHFNKILNLPKNSYSRFWENCYVSFEIKDPASQNPQIIQRVYMTGHSGIPHAQSYQDITTNRIQFVSAPYVYELRGQSEELKQIQNLIEMQSKIAPLFCHDYAREISKITSIQQSLVNAKDNSVRPMKEIIKHETYLDLTRNHGSPVFVDNTASILHGKYTTATRSAIEKEIDNYIKNGTSLTEKNTFDFYKNVLSILHKEQKGSQGAIHNPMIDFELNPKMVSIEIENLAKKLRGVFTFK